MTRSTSCRALRASILLLFAASLAYADDIRVMVSPFGAGDGYDPDLNSKATAIVVDEVTRARGLKYVKPIDNDPDKTSLPDYVVEVFKAADTVLCGAAVRKDDLVEVMLGIDPPLRLGMKEGVDYTATVECDEKRLDKELRRATGELLAKVVKAGIVQADTVGNPLRSQVTYVLKTTDGRYVGVKMDYEKDATAPDISKMSFLPPEGIDGNSKTTVNVMSEQGKTISVEFDYKAGGLEGVTVYAPEPDGPANTTRTESFTLKSEAGYLLDFDFEWGPDGSISSVRIGPRINPFTGIISPE